MMRLLHYNGFKHSAFLCLAMMISLSGFGQKLPFQGKLLENDELVNGTKSFTFNIASRGWTEEHPDISVLDGYYSVVLGEITPLPGDLFQGVDSETMTITVDGQSLGEVLLYKPVGGSSAFKDQDSQVSETIAAFEAEVTGTGVWADQNTQYAGVFGKGNALNGGNAGVRGEADVAAGNVGFNYGVYGLSNSFNGATNATGYGLRGEVNGTYTFAAGVRGFGSNTQAPDTSVDPNPNLNNYGGNFTASGNPYGNMGVYGRAEDGNSPGALNFGVYGEALGSIPENNWAGWFEGNVTVNGDLFVEGNFDFSPPSVQINNDLGDLRAELSSFADNDAGSLVLYGANNTRTMILGSHSGATSNGLLFLYDSLDVARAGFSNNGSVSMFVDDPNGSSEGQRGARVIGDFGVIVSGTDGEVNNILSRNFDNDDFGALYLYGDVANRNLNGGVDIRRIDLKVEDNGFGQDAGRLYLGGSEFGGLNTPYRSFVETGAYSDDGLQHYGMLSLRHSIGEDANLLEIKPEANLDGSASGSIFLNSTQLNTGLRLYGGSDLDNDLNSVVSHIALDGDLDNYVYLYGDGTVDATGNINAASMTAIGGFNQTSDRRLKKNILPLNQTLSKVLQLRGVTYQWKDEASSQASQIGVIAQEVEEIYPEFVHTNSEGQKSVNYAQMVAVLIEAIKEMNGNIVSLESKVAALEEDKSILEKEKADLAKVWSEIDQLKKLLKVGLVSTSQQ
ncbi:MAG: tail fiber domain-containing protein [Cyclobacteriaceae bacterium]